MENIVRDMKLQYSEFTDVITDLNSWYCLVMQRIPPAFYQDACSGSSGMYHVVSDTR